MSLFEACRHLDGLLRNPHQSIQGALLNVQDPPSTLRLFFRLHFPLSLTLPAAALLAPYHYTLPAFPWKHVLWPSLFVYGFLFFAALYDRLIENSKPKLISQWEGRTPARNTAFYVHLLTAGTAFFFFLHPAFGYCMLFAAEILAVFYSIEYSATVHEMSRARALVYWVMAAALPVLILLFVFIIIGLFEVFQVFHQV